MPPLYPSPGPLPSSRAYAAVSQEEIRRAYYQTTSERALPGRQPSAEVVGENFANVHSIGQRDTRYLKWTHNVAPLTTRDACRHTQAYIPLPLGDNIVNSALALNFKKGTQANKAGSMATMDSRTMYEDDFPERTLSQEQERIKQAKQKNKRPPQELTYTVCPPGSLLETESHEHRKFTVPRADIAKAERVPQPRPGLEMGGSVKPVPCRTAYHREFGNAAQLLLLKRSTSTPALLAATATPELKEQAQQIDFSVFNVRRAPQMSPGQ